VVRGTRGKAATRSRRRVLGCAYCGGRVRLVGPRRSLEGASRRPRPGALDHQRSGARGALGTSSEPTLAMRSRVFALWRLRSARDEGLPAETRCALGGVQDVFGIVVHQSPGELQGQRPAQGHRPDPTRVRAAADVAQPAAFARGRTRSLGGASNTLDQSGHCFAPSLKCLATRIGTSPASLADQAWVMMRPTTTPARRSVRRWNRRRCRPAVTFIAGFDDSGDEAPPPVTPPRRCRCPT